MVYNAFPHFPDPRRLIATLAGLLKEGGRLTIAHGMSREAIDNHHSGSASRVSNGLMSAEDLTRLFAPHFQVEVMIESPRMYQVSGIRQGTLTHTHGGVTHSHAALPETEQPALEELLALMKFMVSHNDAHAQELAELASQLEDMGYRRARSQVMDAVSHFDVGNALLDAVVRALTAE